MLTRTTAALFRRNAGVTPGRPRLPPLPQQVEDLGRKHITFRSLRAFRLHQMRMIICSLSMSHRSQPHPLRWPRNQRNHTRRRQHRAGLEARRHGQSTLTSSGLNTSGSVCGSLMCQISDARSWRRKVTRNRKRVAPVMIRLRLQMLAALALDEVAVGSWAHLVEASLYRSERLSQQAANRLQLRDVASLRVRVELASAAPYHSIIR